MTVVGDNYDISYRKKIMRLGISFCIVMTLVECLCCLVYFHYIYHHDNHVAASVISQKVLTSRNKTNAISMVGQAISLVAEFWYIIVIGIFSTMVEFPLLREVGAVVKISDFFIIPFIHILTSAPIKMFIKKEKNQ